MLLPVLVALFSQFQGLNGQVGPDANGVTLAEKVEAMELRLLEPGTIDAPVFPCSNALNMDPARGEQTAAEWVRIIFHDAITYNKTTGLGGLDASIGFEKDRPENIGVAFVNATLIDFGLHSSIYRSISDVIALGLAASMISCDSTQPLIKLRAGRVDATGPGPSGVPGPFDTLNFTKNAFASAGYSNAEMIQSVACGHSLGAVHRKNFGTIVPDTTITLGSDGNDTFDSTPFAFDNTGVIEYLDGVGKRGGPLVVGPDPTAHSDLRIFNSDSNVTIKALRPANTFRSTCFTIFEKLLNTVPNGTVLSDPITPRQWLLRSGFLDLDSANAVRFIATITTHSKTVTAPTKANWFFGTSGAGNTGSQQSDTGGAHQGDPRTAFNTAFGQITDYTINQTLGSTPQSVTSFNIATASAPTTSVYSRALNPNVFIVISQSKTKITTDGTGGVQTGRAFLIRVAIRSTLAVTGSTVTATLYHGTTQDASVAPKFVRQTATLSLLKTQGNFKIYSAALTQALPIANGASHMDAKLTPPTGTAQTSSKVDVANFAPCSNADILTC